MLLRQKSYWTLMCNIKKHHEGATKMSTGRTGRITSLLAFFGGAVFSTTKTNRTYGNAVGCGRTPILVAMA